MNPALQALLRQNFLSFASKAIRELENTKLGAEPYLKYLARELDLFSKEDTRRLIINLPPGHLKTWLASVCLSAWLLAHDASLKIIIVTHAEHLSKTISRNIRTILQSPWYKELFASRIKRGHSEVTDFGTTSGGGVFVSSFRGSITGRRAHVIIVDDPHDIGDDIDRIEATVDTFNTVLLSRLNNRKTGRVLVVAHRVHEFDLSAYLSQNKRWRHVVLPLVATRDQTYKVTSGDWVRRKGNILRPDTFDPEDITELRESAFNPDFEMLYQQNYDSQTSPPIDASHFDGIVDPSTSSGPIVLSVDAGMTNTKRSAYSVIQVWRLMDEYYDLIDQFREQADFMDFRAELRRHRRLYRPVAILIERAANGHALISDMARKHKALVVPIDPDGRSKSARLRAHVVTILAKRIRLPADAVWRDDFVNEFIKFPNGKFTDQIDATTQFLDHATRFVGLGSARPPGLAAISRSSGHSRTVSYSDRREPGLAAGVHSNGRQFISRQTRWR